LTDKVKLLMSWNIRPDQEAKTFEFMAGELAPAIQQLGITPTEATTMNKSWSRPKGACSYEARFSVSSPLLDDGLASVVDAASELPLSLASVGLDSLPRLPELLLRLSVT